MQNFLRRFGFGAAAVGAIGLFSAHVLADSRPSGFHVHSEGWTFVPVVTQTGGTTTVPGILALRYKPEATGDNIVSVWYENPGPSGIWSAAAWTCQDQAKAVQAVKDAYEISDAWDALWPTTDSLQDAVGVTPIEYSKGLFTSDALFEYSTTAEHDELVAALTAIGYKAADIPIDRTGAECEGNAVLSACAEGAIYTATHSAVSYGIIAAQPFGSVLLTCAMAGAGIPPQTWPAPGLLPGTTIPCPGNPINPNWQLDPSDLGHYESSCSTAGTSCCYSRKIRFLYIEPGIIWDSAAYCEADTTWSCPVSPSGGCSATPNCPPPAGPFFPPAGWTANCGHPL